MALQLGDGILGLLYTSIESVGDAVVLVPDVRGTRLQQSVQFTAKFH